MAPTPDWDAIRAAYAAGELAVERLCALHGIGTTRFYQRRKQEGWPHRRPDLAAARERQTLAARAARAARATPAANGAAADGPPPTRRRPVSGAALGRRLQAQVLAAIERLERAGAAADASATPATAADRERDARTLTALVRLMEQAKALGGQRRGGNRQQDDHDLDIDALDAALARHLQSLRRRGAD